MPEYEVKRKGAKATVKPTRDVVGTTVPGLREKIKELVAGGVKTLTIDLSLVKIMDSMGIGLLIAVYNSLTKAEGTLNVVNASTDLFDLFRTMRIDQHFSISKV